MANKVIGISINLILLAFCCFVGWLLLKPSEHLPYCDEIAQPRSVGQYVKCKRRDIKRKQVELTDEDFKLIDGITRKD